MLYLNIPDEVEILIDDNWIQIKGPLGFIKKKKSNLIKISYDPKFKKILLNSPNKTLNNFYLKLINNLIWGVWKGYLIKLNIIGVGYKAFIENNNLCLKVGFSHNIYYNIPKEVNIKILNQKLLTIVITGKSLQKIKQVASDIKSLKPVEHYKGKGIRYFNEIIKLKEGKKTNV